jgi:hypothetical protein
VNARLLARGEHRVVFAAMRRAVTGSILCYTACFGGAQIVLKGPITERCTDAGLKGCDPLTDGVLEYVDGDRDEAVQKIKKGAAENAPEKIRDFAEALRALKSIPGADQYIHPVLEVADLLAPDDAEAKSSSSRASGRAKSSAKREASSENDGRVAAGTLVPSVDPNASPCTPFGDTNVNVDDAAARCVVVATGPLVLTDAQTTGACGNDLLIGAGTPAHPRWALVSTTSAPLNVHGANFGVLNDESLFVVQTAPTASALKGDLRCTITWAAGAR